MTNFRRARALRRVGAAIPLLLVGCAVGPKYVPPPAPIAGDYRPAPPSATVSTPNVAAGDEQRFVAASDVPGEWWALFHSQALDDLVERSLQANPGIKAAQAALLVARENVLAQRGAYFPSVGASFNASRQKTSANVSPTPNSGALTFSLFTPQVTVSYVPDVFGLNRRTVESLQAQAQEARFQLAATNIALSANVVTAAIQEASLRAQIDATHQAITADSGTVAIVRNQFAKGYASRLDVDAQESQLAQVAATLPPLLKQLAQQRHLLAALSGAFPNQELAETFELSSLQLPQDLPVSVPSQLVRQRPDVRQAEENLHAASADIGVAVANRFPNFSLTASTGTMALAASALFAPGAAFWTLGATLAQPIFEGGTLLHREHAARAAYDQAAEQYRSTVLTAFQDVADALSALEQDALAVQTAAAAADAAKTTLDLARRQYQLGYVGYLAVLNAEQTYQSGVINLVQAQASRFADTAALFYALGGGWWNRADMPQ